MNKKSNFGKCKVCEKLFFKRTSLHKICSPQCALSVIAPQSRQKVGLIAPSKKTTVKDKSYYTKKLQVIFNKYIRLRDHPDPCISCGKHRTKYHAGHYLSVGGHSELRFECLNVHKQCVYCNLFLSGNLLNYRNRLINKIGIDKVEWLESKHEPKKYSISDLIDMISLYKEKSRSYHEN